MIDTWCRKLQLVCCTLRAENHMSLTDSAPLRVGWKERMSSRPRRYLRQPPMRMQRHDRLERANHRCQKTKENRLKGKSPIWNAKSRALKRRLRSSSCPFKTPQQERTGNRPTNVT